MGFDDRIVYIISVPDFAPEEASPLQGFAPSLCRNAWLLELLQELPADFAELALKPLDARIARRISGEAPIWWMPLAPYAISSIELGASSPVTVLLVSPEDDASQYMKWKSKNGDLPLIVAEEGGDVAFSKLNHEVILNHCRNVTRKVSDAWSDEERAFSQECLVKWTPASGRKIGYAIGGHNAFYPNVMALLRCGFDSFVKGPFNAKGEGIAPYVKEIVRTANSVIDERVRIGELDINRYNPRRPDLILFAPSMYSGYRNAYFGNVDDAPEGLNAKALQKALLILIRQKGYALTSSGKNFHDTGLEFTNEGVKVNPLIMIRQQELRLNTNAVALLAMSELSAVLRLPNDINRTAGQVKQIAEQRRSSDRRDRKRTQAFRSVQERINAAVPREFFDVIRRSQSGIRIISDAPLEWLDVDGLPLSLRYNVSRIPTTPGNFQISELISHRRLRLKPSAFEEVLVINALNESDPIFSFLTRALETYDPILRNKISLKHVQVTSERDFIEAINNFGGALMIFDGHGSHDPDEPAYLWLGDQKVDVWALRGKIKRMPPIILLSACNTHAVDRNHATAATGFLALGAVTVLGTLFPIPAFDAALFVCRLLHRVAEYVPAVIGGFGRATTWSEIASGMLRMTLLSDYLLRLSAADLIDEDTYLKVHEDGNFSINGGSLTPFEDVIEALKAMGLPESHLRAEFRIAIATSLATSYIQIGRPEVLVFDTQERARRQFDEMNATYARHEASMASRTLIDSGVTAAG